MKTRITQLFALCVSLALAPVALAIGDQKPGSPLDDLPDYIRKVNEWGQRADFSHDGKKILFIEKTFGDAFELDLASGVTTPVTHHYYHGGYTRALYLENGDILLSGTTTFDAENANANRLEKAELWVLDKSLKTPPVRLGTSCFEGPAVSRGEMRICWTTSFNQIPNTDYADKERRVYVADITYADGKPQLANQRKVLSTANHAFFKEHNVGAIETQNFIPGDEGKITLSLYGYMGGTQISVVDLASGDMKVVTDTSNHHTEPEGIFPDGKHTLAESSRQFGKEKMDRPVQYIDIWKVSLDGKETTERMTFFSVFEGYKSSNPVVSDDGRYIAFQMAKLGDPAGVGRGLFILDLKARAKVQSE